MEIKGVKVTLYENVITGEDEFGAPIVEPVPVDVDNVLYSPSTATDVIDDTRLHGTKELYTLAIPKGDTHVWLHNIVSFAGKNWLCYAESEGIETMIPLHWNKKVLVERFDG